VSIKLMNAAFVLDMRPSDKLCLLALADCANDEGLCYPSERTLAVKSSQSERSVRRVIARLLSAGHVSIEARRRRLSTVYRVHPHGPEGGQSGRSSKGGQNGRSSDQDRPIPASKTGQNGDQDRTQLCPPNPHSESPGEPKNPPSPLPQTARGSGSTQSRKSPERQARDASRMAWLTVVQAIERTKEARGATWADTQRWVTEVDPVADAAVRAVGGYQSIGTSQRREETFQRPFRLAYVRAAVNGGRSQP
jgi:hypothetical protein